MDQRDLEASFFSDNKKKLYSQDEQNLIKQISKKIPQLHEENIEFLTLHIKKFLLDAFNKNSKIEIRRFGNFSVRRRKFPFKTTQYRFVHFKMSLKIFEM